MALDPWVSLDWDLREGRYAKSGCRGCKGCYGGDSVRAKKVDATHGAIVNALRNAGVRVHDTSAVGFGYPDLHCSYRGYSALVECKSGPKGLRESQRNFIDKWEGPVIVARTGEEAVTEFFKAYGCAILQSL